MWGTSQLRKDCQYYLGKLRNIKKIEKVVKRAKMATEKARRVGGIVRIKESVRTRARM